MHAGRKNSILILGNLVAPLFQINIWCSYVNGPHEKLHATINNFWFSFKSSRLGSLCNFMALKAFLLQIKTVYDFLKLVNTLLYFLVINLPICSYLKEIFASLFLQCLGKKAELLKQVLTLRQSINFLLSSITPSIPESWLLTLT